MSVHGSAPRHIIYTVAMLYLRRAAPARRGIAVIAGDMPLDLFLDDVVQLRKPHPCGSVEWRVARLGADIGLVCLGCGRRILLPRSTPEKRLQPVVSRRRILPAPPV